MRKIYSSTVLLFLIMATSGCVNFDSAKTANISEECRAAIQQQNEAWSNTDTPEEQIQTAEVASLSACKDLDEWSTAVSYNPGSMGYSTLGTEEAANTVYLACASNDPENQTPVCADAAKRGYLE